MWAVNGMGGSSRLNAMIWTRGSPQSYNRWSESGLSEWSWEKVEPYFKKLENAPRHRQISPKGARGIGGPIELQKPSYPYKWPEL